MPVKHWDGSVAGALSVVGPGNRMDQNRLENEYAELIELSANIVEVNATSL